MVKFLRRDAKRFLKFGKGRGNKAKWRSPKGRDNKMREKKKGYPAVVSIGYSKDKKLRGKIAEKEVVKVDSMRDLERMNKDSIGILGKMGKKKKMEIAKEISKRKLQFQNFNADLYLKKMTKEKKND